MEERRNILDNYYNNDCNEEERLLSRHGSVEFLTTINYIEKYLKEGDSILEVGAGTGRYSLYFANNGYKVNALEYVKYNLDILKSKITDNMNINAELGDALDLSRYEDNKFDVTLVFGPLYHLYTDEDIDKAISEAVRVTKSGGLIGLAYLTNDSVMLSYSLKKGHLIDGYGKAFDNNFEMTSDPKEVFRTFYIDEFNNMMDKYNVEFLHSIASDGMSSHFKDIIDNLNDDEFDVWMKYHLSTCERFDLQGYSNHMLYLCRKR